MAFVGIFNDHDGTVHQHAHGEDQTKHHDVGNRNAHDCEQNKAQKERGGDRKADQQCRTQTQGCQNNDHHQRNCGKDRTLQLLHHAVDDAALVVGRAHFDGGAQALGPGAGFLGYDLFHQRRSVDEVKAFALDHLQSDRVVTVKSRGAVAVLERQVDLGQIAQRDHAVAIGFHRQCIDIARLIEGGGDLDRKAAVLGRDFTGCDQLVIVLHDIDQLARGHIVGFKAQGIDHDLQHFIAVAGNRSLKHGI